MLGEFVFHANCIMSNHVDDLYRDIDSFYTTAHAPTLARGWEREVQCVPANALLFAARMMRFCRHLAGMQPSQPRGHGMRAGLLSVHSRIGVPGFPVASRGAVYGALERSPSHFSRPTRWRS